MSRHVIGRPKDRCHASLIVHSTEGGSTCQPTSSYGHCSGDWCVCIREAHGLTCRWEKPVWTVYFKFHFVVVYLDSHGES